jgi:hypothetical protein
MTFKNVVMQYWSSNIGAVYFKYKGSYDNCTLDPTQYTYVTDTLLQHKVRESDDGNCGFLFYLGNNNTNGGAFTINIFRDDATTINFMAVVLSVVQTFFFYLG